jgi:NAD(P)-dependent dehydrogenase (short-subunit alcohol dehydrogenase family)
MTNNDRKVLVTGATGKQGGSLVRHMLGKGWNLVALARDPKSRAAKALLEKGVEVVRGDMEDASSLDGAFPAFPASTECAGSTRRASTRISRSCTRNILTCASGRSSNGSTTRAGTSARGAYPFSRNDLAKGDAYAHVTAGLYPVGRQHARHCNRLRTS